MAEDQTPDPMGRTAEEIGRQSADTTIWALRRLVIGPVLIMFMAGILHHHVSTGWPAWSFATSAAVAMSLTLVAWFFRR